MIFGLWFLWFLSTCLALKPFSKLRGPGLITIHFCIKHTPLNLCSRKCKSTDCSATVFMGLLVALFKTFTGSYCIVRGCPLLEQQRQHVCTQIAPAFQTYWIQTRLQPPQMFSGLIDHACNLMDSGNNDTLCKFIKPKVQNQMCALWLIWKKHAQWAP